MSNEEVKIIANFVRNRFILQGDHYASYTGVSPDAEQLAQAIEEKFLLPEEKQ